MNMDHELRDALRRKQAPRIWPIACSRASTRARRDHSARPGSSVGSNSAAVAGRSGGRRRGRRRRRALLHATQQAAEAARVKEELRLALQITNDTLARVQSKLSQPADNGGR